MNFDQKVTMMLFVCVCVCSFFLLGASSDTERDAWMESIRSASAPKPAEDTKAKK